MIVLPETDADAAAAQRREAAPPRRIARRSDLEDGHVLTITLTPVWPAGWASTSASTPSSATPTPRSTRPRPSAATRSTSSTRSRTTNRSAGPRSARRPAERAVEVGRLAAGDGHGEPPRGAREPRPAWAGRPSTMIAEMSVSLARAIDLPDREIERIRIASLLHDLGKLAIPDEILSNPGELTEPEWRVVSEHPKIGQVVLEQAGALRDAATIVLHHHEWFDGRGYPHGLNGEEIPVGARIVAIADAYEAMVAGRPYRRAINHDQALARAPSSRRGPVRPASSSGSSPSCTRTACRSPSRRIGRDVAMPHAHAHEALPVRRWPTRPVADRRTHAPDPRRAPRSPTSGRRRTDRDVEAASATVEPDDAGTGTDRLTRPPARTG